jgi:hypothetical protein
MEYSYEIDNDRNIIIVMVQGLLIPDEAASMGLAIRLMARDMKAGIIFDFRQAKNCISVFQAYLWFSNNYDKTDTRFRYIPTVHIPNEKDIDFFRFVQVAWTNSGVCMRMYTDMDEAIEWILSYKISGTNDVWASPDDMVWGSINMEAIV